MLKIDKFMQDEKNIEIIAKEIKDAFVQLANKDNIDYSFSTSLGKVKTKEANTFFVFDTPDGSKLKEFKKAMFDTDLSDVTSGSKEEEEIMTKVRYYIVQICKEMTSKYKKDFEKVVREVVLEVKAQKKLIL